MKVKNPNSFSIYIWESVTEYTNSIWISLEVIIGLLKQMVEKVPNCYRETDVDEKAFLAKVLQFDLLWILSIIPAIM